MRLAVGEQGGSFEQTWRLDSHQAVPLPGDERTLPLDLQAGGEVAPVTIREGRPVTHLPPGRHRLTGRFVWDALPESLRIPPDTAILSLEVAGEHIEAFEREADGTLWLARRVVEEVGPRELGVTVFRKLEDDVPARLTTIVELRVSGVSREERLGAFLPEGFEAFAIDSPLPARIDADGTLLVRVKPGTHNVTIEAAAARPPSRITTPETQGHWPRQEFWAVAHRPELRRIEIVGVPAVDPEQTRLPAEWRRLPAYLMGPGDEMRIVERERGLPERPDRLHLRRELWLDLDGSAFSIRDSLRGSLNQGRRIEAGQGLELTRVTMGGRDVLINRLGDGAAGVEVRHQAPSILAEGRVPRHDSRLAAVGWDRDVDSLSMTLHIPPGWTLFGARGADEVAGTWLGSWSLMDLFLILLFTFVVGRLLGLPMAALAFVTLALTVNESGAPRLLWGLVIALEAARRALAGSRFERASRAALTTGVLLLGIVAAFFVVEQARIAIDPVLEHPGHDLQNRRGPIRARSSLEIPSPRAMFGSSLDALAGELSEALMEDDAADGPRVGAKRAAPAPSIDEPSLDVDPDAVVQTGLGLPAWRWRSASLSWSGPVAKDASVTLHMLPPWASRALALARALLTLALVIALAGFGRRLSRANQERAETPSNEPENSHAAKIAGLVLSLCALLVAPSAAHAGERGEIPSEKLLEQLKDHLTKQPPCHPSCASLTSLALSATEERLLLEMSVDVAALTVVPLAGTNQRLTPSEVRLNGRPAEALLGDSEGRVWLRLERGRHRITTSSRLPRSASVQVPLPMSPGRVKVSIEGWDVMGLAPDGTPRASLELVRVLAADERGDQSEGSASLPPLVRVERRLELGLDWRAVTRVVRESPAGTPVSLRIPLLKGESVTSESVLTNGEAALALMEPHETEVVWRSRLSPSGSIHLRAPEEGRWTESWVLAVGPTWHVRVSGVPEAARDGDLRFHPHPGEELVIEVSRPSPAEGQSLTIDSSTLVVRPDRRVTRTELTMVLRTSRAGHHSVSLPPEAVVESLRIDGRDAPVSFEEEDGAITFPVHPGRQSVNIQWREERPLGPSVRAGGVDLNAPGANARVSVAPPPDRWLLWTFGPGAGPSVLFWPLLMCLLVAAAALSRSRLTPLGFRDWAILGVGLTQVPLVFSMVVAGWLLALGHRGERADLSRSLFNLRQMALVAGAALVACVLVAAVVVGLGGSPDMRLAGNASSATNLVWYVDRVDGPLPEPTVVSAPIVAFRGMMLLWALWLAIVSPRLLGWAWPAFKTGGAWRGASDSLR